MSAAVAALARKVFEEYSRAGGNPPDAHFDRNAAEQWMAHALEFAGVAELIRAAGSMTGTLQGDHLLVDLDSLADLVGALIRINEGAA